MNNVVEQNKNEIETVMKKNKIRFLYVNQPSSISMRELPFLGPVRTGEGARD